MQWILGNFQSSSLEGESRVWVDMPPLARTVIREEKGKGLSTTGNMGQVTLWDADDNRQVYWEA